MAGSRNFRDFEAVIAAALSLGLGLAIVILLKKQFGVEDVTVLAVLLIVPLLMYVVVSGRIIELRGPFGLHAIFTKNTIEKEQIKILHITAKKNKEIEPLTIEELKKRPTALKFILTGDNDLDYKICDYLDALSKAASFKYVIFTMLSNEFIGMIPAKAIMEAPEFMSSDDKCGVIDLIDWVVNRKFDEINKLQGFIWKEESASPDWKKDHCLKVFQRKNADVLPVVMNNSLIGVIEKSKIISSLVLDIINSLEN